MWYALTGFKRPVDLYTKLGRQKMKWLRESIFWHSSPNVHLFRIQQGHLPS
jgi:hypothetical protein